MIYIYHNQLFMDGRTELARLSIHYLFSFFPVGESHCSSFKIALYAAFFQAFQPQCKKILTRLYRVFVHVYVHHFDRIMSIGKDQLEILPWRRTLYVIFQAYSWWRLSEWYLQWVPTILKSEDMYHRFFVALWALYLINFIMLPDPLIISLAVFLFFYMLNFFLGWSVFVKKALWKKFQFFTGKFFPQALSIALFDEGTQAISTLFIYGYAC